MSGVRKSLYLLHLRLAEREGFEPSLGCLFPKTVSKCSSPRPCCSESIIYGG